MTLFFTTPSAVSGVGVRKLTEPSGTAGATVTTTYGYDVGNRLKTVSTTSGAFTQARTFTYDNRGFLTPEQLPEKGASGNGTVTYSNYDARGHARRIQDGAHELAFTYDRTERLTRVAQADASGNPFTPMRTSLARASCRSASFREHGLAAQKPRLRLTLAFRWRRRPSRDVLEVGYSYACGHFAGPGCQPASP